MSRSTRPFDSLHLLTNFEYWWKKIQFEQQFRANRHAASFVNCYYVDFICTSTRDLEKFFVRMPLQWYDYEVSRLLIAPTHMAFAQHSTLVLCAERYRFLFLSCS